MRKLIAAIKFEEEDNDLLVSCMSDSTTNIFKKRWRMLLQFDMKVFDGQGDEIRGIFRSFEGIYHFILKHIKEDVTPSCSRWQTPISAEQKLSYTKVSKKVIIFDRDVLTLLTRSVITVTQKVSTLTILFVFIQNLYFINGTFFFVTLKAVLIQTGI